MWLFHEREERDLFTCQVVQLIRQRIKKDPGEEEIPCTTYTNLENKKSRVFLQ